MTNRTPAQIFRSLIESGDYSATDNQPTKFYMCHALEEARRKDAITAGEFEECMAEIADYIRQLVANSKADNLHGTKNFANGLEEFIHYQVEDGEEVAEALTRVYSLKVALMEYLGYPEEVHFSVFPRAICGTIYSDWENRTLDKSVLESFLKSLER